MITNTASPTSHYWYEEENHLAVTDQLEEQGTATFSGRRLVKWFGALSTALLGAAALAPNALGISAGLQPWVFVTFIFWFFAFCAGMFDL